ncbi:DNA topoisomerase [Pyrenophora tritici-repentis]|uniref:DNA topoisomerase I n=3 Tax=Pyrenophora tritici-repentis TaxID=45151 RepID=A0A922SZJ9_9PLEO|nr:DNA topoisomerase 1 [Pyrenophora tritici-repentis Pt-1C-BFP]EDU50532.1 DNA topoisomerase 1 [Pyrenophora tritici-repentis Pt-1C-BFP]KAI1515305.1 DNA topoisomerase [Pyrenophora tritici-repentis]KAI1664201.1 DNA topoisomerase [Pyrenophora tritici-repentis]KAI1678289.1 DNA topoisomerase [Pyrenophora tritici-repentis]
MSSSDDDTPLARGKDQAKSSEQISKEEVMKMDAEAPSNGHVEPGISIRMGPVDNDKMDIDAPETNGNAAGKRKSRGSIPNGKSYKDASSSEEDAKPLNKRRRTSQQAKPVKDESDSELSDVPLRARVLPKASAEQIGESADSDVPLATKLTKKKESIEKAAAKEAKAIRTKDKAAPKRKQKVESESEEDVPLVKKRAPAKKTNGVKKQESDSDAPIAKKSAAKKATKAKPAAAAPAKKTKAKPKEETEQDNEAADEEDEYRWWDDPGKNDGTKKWDTLEHAGVVFPPEYEPLPKHVKLVYDGVPVTLHKDAEEVATFYGSMLNSTHNVENPTFNKNFFEDFTAILDKTGHGKDKNGNTIKIKKFEKCDFKPIFEWFDAERAKKKALSAAEKKALKAEKEAAEADYMYCLWDGRKQKVGNFRVEPPGLFRGRGEHPKTGRVKKRVMPEQITINIGENAKVPEPPAGHRWKEIKHDHEGTWLAMWQENINGAYKYVMLAANSDIKGQSDFKKFEKARELKKHIDRIRKDYRKDLNSKMMADRQRATAIYLIDQFALRAGNEKGEDEADTVGCCSLKFQHITLRPPETVIFDFLGKDSIRFYDEVKVDPQVFKNLKLFKKEPKTTGDDIFDRLTTSALNKHLTSYMPGLTAKVFRTYNASYTMARLLKEMKATGTVQEKVKAYNDANREVAILCNHKRTVAASHATSIEKMNERINGLRYQAWRTKMMMIDVDPKIKKKKGAEYFERPEDLDDEWVKQHQDAEVEEMRQKIIKKFEKDNEKLKADGEKELKQKELNERLEKAEELAAKYKKENKTGKIEAEGKGPTVEKLEANVEKIVQRIENMKIQMEDKEGNKEVALGTSKINYIDPRLTVVFSKKFGVPIEKFFSKTLREKFDWAIKSVDENWEF